MPSVHISKIYLVFYETGNFHSSTVLESQAVHIASKIEGYISEQDVYRVRQLPEEIPSASMTEIDPATHVRRGRPQRKIDDDQFVKGSTEPLDPPKAA
jgi:hypothetical protein